MTNIEDLALLAQLDIMTSRDPSDLRNLNAMTPGSEFKLRWETELFVNELTWNYRQHNEQTVGPALNQTTNKTEFGSQTTVSKLQLAPGVPFKAPEVCFPTIRLAFVKLYGIKLK